MKNKDLSIIQEAVLMQIPKGLEKPVRSKEIADRTGLSQREVMAVISALVTDHSIPIGGVRAEGRQGYFIITDEKERKQAIVPLRKSIVNMKKRVEQLEKMEI